MKTFYSHCFKILGLLLLFFAINCGGSQTGKEKKSEQEAALKTLKEKKGELEKQIKVLENSLGLNIEKQIKKIKVHKVQPSVFKFYTKLLGRVDAESNIKIAPLAIGEISKIYKKEGDRVKKGELLAQIDDRIISKELEALKVQLENAKIVYEKYDNLYKQGIGAEVEWLQRKAQRDQLESNYQAMKKRKEDHYIKAPIQGILNDFPFKLGQVVNPANPSDRFSIINDESFKFKASIPESYATYIKPNLKCLIEFPIINQKTEHTINFISKVVNPNSRSFDISVALPKSKYLSINMLGSARILLYENKKSLSIPIEYILEDSQANSFVYLYKDGRAKKSIIDKGMTYNGIVEVKRGLQINDQIIIDKTELMSEGDRVSL